MFGSFQEELASEPCIYGIRKPLRSYNPFWANIHVYWAVFLDSLHARRWQDKIRVWFQGPGWRPAGLDETHPLEQISLEGFSKFDPVVTKPVRIYAFFQFVCTTLAGTGMLIVAKNLAPAPLFFAVGLISFSFYLQSAWTEGRAFARWLEWPKLALVFVALAYLQLSPGLVLTVQTYLLISVLFLSWLTVNPGQMNTSTRLS